MHEHRFTLAGADGTQIAAWRWTGEAVHGVVQIAHGMGEHSGRYRNFVEALTAAGFAVYANDHRGHGATVAGRLGDLGQGGFGALVDDMARLTTTARVEQPGQPVILFGHSMGSFAAQSYLVDHGGLLAGLVLSGSAALDKRPAEAVRPAGRARLADYNAAFHPARTPFDWLSRDPAAVDAYRADPLCGFSLTPDSRATMLAGAARAADPTVLAGVAPGLPLYLLTGDSDPVNGMTAWFWPLAERYRAAGLTVTARVWPGGRHEMLNEVNRDEVVAELLVWLESVRRTARPQT